ncbi:MAG TPA: ectoine hydroxylase [Burkholderiales bacterium]|nr:ectoine hydroxylase [Burkholderiales bacterium]
MVLPISDAYQSRSDNESAILRRQDPVVYGRADEPGLTEHQLKAYLKNGFVFLKEFFRPDEVAVFLREARRLAADPAIGGREEAIREPDSDQVRSIFAAHRLDPLFDRVARDARLAAIARQILGSAVYVHQSRLNLKPGFFGKDFYWHSDFETWHVEDGMPRMRALSCTILLTDNNELNGPLLLVPGSHTSYISCVGETPEDHYRASLKKQECGVPDPMSLGFLIERGGIRSMKGAAGSVIFFDCNTMHGSNSNISPYPRANLFMVYNSVENKLGAPRYGLKPRPEFIAAREHTPPVEPAETDYAAWR